ncbi:MAG: NUDIX hydrolase [Candidatus Hydrogenedentes bacterium]|nr:NUDIX hydrolase [Candidatus Hydrogenedentota bacterium]
MSAIVADEGKLLLVKHQKEGETYWLLPGGGVDFGESLEEALVREVKEETNLDIEVGAPVLVSDTLPPDLERHVVNIVFTAERTGGNLRTGEDPRLADAVFVEAALLPGLILYPDMRQELMNGLRTGFPDRAQYLGKVWGTRTCEVSDGCA